MAIQIGPTRSNVSFWFEEEIEAIIELVLDRHENGICICTYLAHCLATRVQINNLTVVIYQYPEPDFRFQMNHGNPTNVFYHVTQWQIPSTNCIITVDLSFENYNGVVDDDSE